MVDTTDAPPLLEAGDIAAFPDGPFDASVVSAAADAVRHLAGWHIAPRVTETLAVESLGGRALFLPTLRLVQVTAVRDVTGSTPRALTGYGAARTADFLAGVLVHPVGWPVGQIAVDVIHGHETCPPALFPAVAELAAALARGDLSQRTLGDQSESWRASLTGASGMVLDRFRISGGP